MNDLYLTGCSFLLPYIKQFRKLLNNDKIALYGDKSDYVLDYLKRENLTIVDDENTTVDGIILNNLDKNTLEYTISSITKILNDEGIILLINNNKIVDETTINYLFQDNYNIVEELIGDAKWKFILYQKKTTK